MNYWMMGKYKILTFSLRKFQHFLTLTIHHVHLLPTTNQKELPRAVENHPAQRVSHFQSWSPAPAIWVWIMILHHKALANPNDWAVSAHQNKRISTRLVWRCQSTHRVARVLKTVQSFHGMRKASISRFVSLSLCSVSFENSNSQTEKGV